MNTLPYRNQDSDFRVRDVQLEARHPVPPCESIMVYGMVLHYLL